MEVHKKEITTYGIRFSISIADKEVARAYLYVFRNDLHKEPFGLLEDLFVHEQFRKQGLGTKIVQAALETAKRDGFYKVIATSRYTNEEAHNLYRQIGFDQVGDEFRMNLKPKNGKKRA